MTERIDIRGGNTEDHPAVDRHDSALVHTDDTDRPCTTIGQHRLDILSCARCALDGRVAKNRGVELENRTIEYLERSCRRRWNASTGDSLPRIAISSPGRERHQENGGNHSEQDRQQTTLLQQAH